MNRLVIVRRTAVLLALLFAGTQTMSAQTVFAGLGYHNHVGQALVKGGLYFPVTNAIQAGADLGFLLGTETDGGDETAIVANVNGRYPLLKKEGPQVYALAGLNMYRWSWKGDGFDESDTIFGVNLGGMTEINVGSFDLFGEVKIILNSDSSPFVFAVGVSKDL